MRQRTLSPADAGFGTRTRMLRPWLGLCYQAQGCNLRTKDRVSQVSSKPPIDKGTGQDWTPSCQSCTSSSRGLAARTGARQWLCALVICKMCPAICKVHGLQ